MFAIVYSVILANFGAYQIRFYKFCLRAAAKRAEIRAANNGHLTCDHCKTDWYGIYGHAIAEAIFDVHHTIPLKDMDEGHETTVADLLCLCANCHRAEHRRMAVGVT